MNNGKTVSKDVVLKTLNVTPLYKGKVRTILNFLIERNLKVTNTNKELFINYVKHIKKLSKSYEYQYKKAFDLIASSYDQFYINGLVPSNMMLKGKNLPDIIKDFINKTNAGEKSANKYRYSILRFYEKYDKINYNNVKNFIDNCEVANNTKKQYLRDIKAYTEYLYNYSHICKNDFVEIKNIRVKGSEQIKKDILTIDEVTRLIQYAPNIHKLEIALCFYAALRYHETKLYKYKKDYIEVKGKGSKKMRVAVSKSLKLIIESHDEITNYELFSDWLKKSCKLLFKKYITTHCLRTSFAIHLYIKTKDIQLVKRHLRHESIKTTSRYLDHITDIDYFKTLENKME